jgi:hypothetical protein
MLVILAWVDAAALARGESQERPDGRQVPIRVENQDTARVPFFVVMKTSLGIQPQALSAELNLDDAIFDG